MAERFRDSFAGRDLPKDTSFNEADVRDKLRYVRTRPLIDAARQADMVEAYQQRLEALQSFDVSVDRMLDALAAAGELRNTVLIVTSDNGYLRGEHRIHAGKTVP